MFNKCVFWVLEREVIENGIEEIIEVIIVDNFLKLILEKVDFWLRNIIKDEKLNYKIIKSLVY